MSAPENQACRLIGKFECVHKDCSMYADGIITNVLTGKIVGRMIDGKRVDRT